MIYDEKHPRLSNLLLYELEYTFTSWDKHCHMFPDLSLFSGTFFHRKASRTALLPLAQLFCLLYFFCPATAPAAELFPSYPAIRANVAFWEKIYSTYSSNTAVIHDRNDLSKIYEVVPLMDRGVPGAGRLNAARVKATIDKYQTALTKLADGKSPASATERRVAQLFNGSRSRQRMALAAESVRSQTGLKELFSAGVVRSGGYMPAIRKIFRKHGLPVELAYLPHVESSFNTEAYSKVGAAGIWQFTPGTGKQYMRIDDVIDERSDPFIAAEAAAKYLKNSYEKLGSWPLALTAYNYGTAGMMRAQDAKGSYERIFAEYQEGHFGFASRNFYSEFLAALHVARQLEASPRIQIDRPIQYTEYVLPGYIRLRDIRRHFQISDSTLKQYNPAIRPSVYSGSKLLPHGYRLRLPARNTIRNLAASVPRSTLHGNQIQDQYHRVKSGDNLGRIAARYGVSVKALQAANGLKRNAKIIAGQRLRLPSRTAAASSRQSSSSLAAANTTRSSGGKQVRTAAAKQRVVLVLSAENSKIERIASK